ncbi:glycosyl hydrolase family 18 protein [Sphingopyxis sp. MSC1_008]|jgi:chitinase|uniref:glycosyl hydrolase family 18 protein n=1 Tax=Sphingopyxis sp. MSC1_008 TaxID=2909265 RepID=UPI0020BF7279|nr:glycosyl hydrolase family 18 protein [Sphingopyxis sp. MSC1_008]
MTDIRAFRFIVSILIGFILVLSSAAIAGEQRRPVVVGYLAAFKGLDMSIERTDLSAFTHFNLSFANPDAAGKFIRDGRMTCMGDETGANLSVDALRKTVAKLQTSGAKVLISTAGGVIPGCSGDWKALLAPDRRAATIAALVDLADTLNLDGVDIDIEGQLLTEIDRAGDYTPFVAALSKTMKARGKLLTCATASYEGGMIPVGSIPHFDLVNVMSYDAIGPSWGEPGAEHSSFAMAERDLDLWLVRGVAPDRLILGVPFYGYGFGGEKANWSYRDLAATYGKDATNADAIGDRCGGCRYITHNSPPTIEKKSHLAAVKAGGVMVWELSQDTADHALTQAIKRGLSRE